jgi:predicted metalloprotease with PDZ domain
VSGVEEIRWNEFFDHAGLMLEEKKGPTEPYFGITTGTSIPTGAGAFGPATTPVPEGQIAITAIAQDSPAASAGLDIGDILVAIDGDRVDPATLKQRLDEKKIGSTIQFAVLRRNLLITIPVVVGGREPITYSIKEKPNAAALQKQIFTSWLAEKSFEQ